MKNHSNPEIVKLAEVLKNEYENKPHFEDIWKTSELKWLRALSGSAKGNIFEELVTSYFTKKGFIVKPSNTLEYDRLFSLSSQDSDEPQLKVEIKGSTLWQRSYIYSFGGLRNQNYDLLILLGLSPKIAHCWVIEKRRLMKNDQWKPRQKFQPQYGGAAKEVRHVFRLQFRPLNAPKPTNTPDWLKEFGGSLEDATKVLKKIFKEL